jgi:hypothetical protein
MTVAQIEKRLTALEAEVARLKAAPKAKNPWWDKIAGVFADNPRFEKAMRNGRALTEPHEGKAERGKKPAASGRRAAK